MRAYFDNASTTPLLPEVIEEMIKVMKESYGNPSSIHLHGRTSRSIIEAARKTVANILNTSIGEIFFTSGATEANNMILKCACEQLGVKRIIHSPIEHHCILHTLEHLEKTCGIETISLDLFDNHKISTSHLKQLLSNESENTLVSVMHGNNEIGVINDIAAIGSICEEYGAYFHSDIVQTVGKYPLDLEELNLHFASGSAHKFHGPKGVGFAYIRNDAIISPYLHGGSQERNMRAGTENLYGIAGMAKALELCNNNQEKWQNEVSTLKERFISQLRETIPGVELNCQADGLYHIASVSFPSGPKTSLLMFNLDIAGISASSGSACSSGIEADSHVLTAIKHPSDRKTIRFSFSHFNTVEEIDYAVKQIQNFCVETAAV